MFPVAILWIEAKYHLEVNKFFFLIFSHLKIAVVAIF